MIESANAAAPQEENGSVNRAQERIQRLLDSLVREGRERGMQVAAYLDGNLVVDAWAGLADAATGRPVDGETLFPVFSVTKGVAATIVHILVQRGQLAYDTPLAELWPEFGRRGKSGITLRHALSHMAGLPFMPMGLGYRDLADWDAMCRAIADLAPSWPAGTQQIYHAVTYGWLVGEAACRAAGRPFARLLADEIVRPLGLGGLFVGIPDEAEERVAVLESPPEPGQAPPPDDSVPRDVPGWMHPLHAMMNRPDARRACIPASNGIMNARSLARHYAALLPGGVNGIELLPPHRVREATVRQIPAGAAPESLAGRIALGYFIGGEGDDMGHRPTVFGHGGFGGSIGFADPEHRLAVGFTKNLFSSAGAGGSVLRELREALGAAM